MVCDTYVYTCIRLITSRRNTWTCDLRWGIFASLSLDFVAIGRLWWPCSTWKGTTVLIRWGMFQQTTWSGKETFQWSCLAFVLISSLKVCWLCSATKGAEDLSLCLTNVGHNSLWWNTLHQTMPWDDPPAFSSLIGFHISQAVPDLLHIWNLGVARDLLGSGLRIIMTDSIIFNAPTIADRLALGTDALKRFAKTHRLPLRLRKFTKNKLTWGTNKYPCLCVSGYDAYVVGRWMETLLASYQDVYPEIYTMLWASNKAMSLQYHASRFLTIDEKASLQTLGDVFLRTYLYMASASLREHKFLWRVRPKMHMLCHVFRSPRCVNQSVYSTWMDEDFLKKCGKTLGLTTNKTAQKRLLERWLLALPRNLVKTLVRAGSWRFALGEKKTWESRHKPGCTAQGFMKKPFRYVRDSFYL